MSSQKTGASTNGSGNEIAAAMRTERRVASESEIGEEGTQAIMSSGDTTTSSSIDANRHEETLSQVTDGDGPSAAAADDSAPPPLARPWTQSRTDRVVHAQQTEEAHLRNRRMGGIDEDRSGTDDLDPAPRTMPSDPWDRLVARKIDAATTASGEGACAPTPGGGGGEDGRDGQDDTPGRAAATDDASVPRLGSGTSSETLTTNNAAEKNKDPGSASSESPDSMPRLSSAPEPTVSEANHKDAMPRPGAYHVAGPDATESDPARPAPMPRPVAHHVAGPDATVAAPNAESDPASMPRPGAYHVAGPDATNAAPNPESDPAPDVWDEIGGPNAPPQDNEYMVSAKLVEETTIGGGYNSSLYHASPVTWKDTACSWHMRLALAGMALVVLGVGLGLGLRTPPSAAPTAIATAVPTAVPTNSPTEYVWCPSDKILPNDGATDDRFGKSVAIFGDTVVVGARYVDVNRTRRESAYVFTRMGTSWEQQYKLLPSDAVAGDCFCGGVAIYGDTVVIGNPLHNGKGENSGAAYVFTRVGTAWEEQDKLLPEDGMAGDEFGGSVAIYGDTVVVGAHLDGDNGSNSGSAYVFTRTGTTWEEQYKLLASDGAKSDEFGISVAIYGDTIVVGADKDDNEKGYDSGAAYVFARTESESTWSQLKLLANDGAADDRFGHSVAIYGDTIVVGANRDDNEKGKNCGSVYVFTRIGAAWEEQGKLLPNDGREREYFGWDVAIHGDTVLVGTNYEGDVLNSGSAYVFYRMGSTWEQQKKLLANDGAVDDWFGRSVGLDGNISIVGADRDDDSGIDSGSAHIIELC